MRYFIELAFNGENYHGWQIQPDASSVQQTLEESLSTLLRNKTEIIGAGRTDAGVHAKQLFAHFDTPDELQNEQFKFKLNSYLPNDIAVKSISKVNDNAHARFDALSRTYEYHVHTEKDPFLDAFSYRLVHIPDIEKMNEAAKMLYHYTDFQCFSKSKTDVKTYHCKVKVAAWEQHENKLIFTITADRFLRNMVRAIVGTLLEIGLGKKEIHALHKIIESKNRSNAGTSVPAKGLYLTEITYTKELFI